MNERKTTTPRMGLYIELMYLAALLLATALIVWPA